MDGKKTGGIPSSWEPKAEGSSGLMLAVKRVVKSVEAPWRSCFEYEGCPGVEAAERGSQPGRGFCCQDAGDWGS